MVRVSGARSRSPPGRSPPQHAAHGAPVDSFAAAPNWTSVAPPGSPGSRGQNATRAITTERHAQAKGKRHDADLAPSTPKGLRSSRNREPGVPEPLRTQVEVPAQD